MNKSLSAMQLDFRTVKKYTSPRYLLLFVGIPLLFSLLYSPGFAIGLVMVYGMFFSGYPFAVGEITGMDVLYASLPLPRKSLIMGRYLFALSVNLLTGLGGLVISLTVAVVTRTPLNLTEALWTVAVCFCIFSTVELIQIPVFFKQGYTKARLVSYLPLFLLAGGVAALSSVQTSNRVLTQGFLWLSQNLTLTVCLVLAVWLVLLFASVNLSYRLYSKREF